MKLNLEIICSKYIIRFGVLFLFIVFNLPVIISKLSSQPQLGIQIGRSHSKFIESESGDIDFYDLSENFDHKGFLLNLTYAHYLNKYFSVQPSIGYVKRGTNLQTNIGIVGYDKFSLNYINISMLLGISPFKFISFSSGLNVGYLIKATDYASRSSTSTKKYNRLDIGLKSGVSLLFKNIEISANYYHGLKPVDTIDLGAFIDPEVKRFYNRSLEFSIGYMIDLNKKESHAPKNKTFSNRKTLF